MSEPFCVFILSHGRPDHILTYKTIRRAGYSGKVFIVIDNEDKTAARYREKFGKKVMQFDKLKVSESIDEGDNFQDRRAIIYARNVCFDLAEQIGFRYFIELDDDYSSWYLRYRNDGSPCSFMVHKTLEQIFSALVEFLHSCPPVVKSVALAQGGDLIGGVEEQDLHLKRKAMNSFVCSTERRFPFFGRINEDVNVYTTSSRRGDVFFTTIQAHLVQQPTQKNSGGMTDLYLNSGTYVKSFYTVMYCPSSVKISTLGDEARCSGHYRIHHRIDPDATYPKIMAPMHKKKHLTEEKISSVLATPM